MNPPRSLVFGDSIYQRKISIFVVVVVVVVVVAVVQFYRFNLEYVIMYIPG